jgi:hypothetical protein
MGGEPPRVFAVLSKIVEDCLEQLREMSVSEVKQIVESIPAGLRMMVEPVTEPLTEEYLNRVAEYAIAVELEKGYSPVSDVVHSHPEQSYVLEELPELRDLIDNDGLIKLNANFVLFDGGIRYRDFVLHYHQFLRRGFSCNPNFDFLSALAKYRNGTGRSNNFRIAIDHRRLMRFEDYRQTIERDRWYGPAFDREKLDDPGRIGLTVVGRINPNALDSYPIEKTEFLMKLNEGEAIKTLEIEELSSSSNPYDGWHINRYLHAERDMPNKVFCHFDGAAKVYAPNKYKNRISQTMPNQPRCDYYIKLFRIDGEIILEDWLSLVGMFYKGNEMVIEYFDPKLFDEKIRPLRIRMGQIQAL